MWISERSTFFLEATVQLAPYARVGHLQIGRANCILCTLPFYIRDLSITMDSGIQVGGPETISLEI